MTVAATPLPVQCPAARPIAEAAGGLRREVEGRGRAVLCDIAAAEIPATDQITHGHNVSPVYRESDDSPILAAFCCGTQLPVIDSVPEDGKAHHTACPIWRAHKERLWENRKRLADPKRRGHTTPFGLGKAQKPEDFLLTAEQMATQGLAMIDPPKPKDRRR